MRNRNNIVVFGIALLVPIYIGRIQEVIPFLNSLYIGKLAIFLALCLILIAPKRTLSYRGFLTTVQMKCIMGITILIILSIPDSLWPGASFEAMINWFKTLVFIGLLVLCINTREDVMKVIWSMILTLGVLIAYSFINPKLVEGNRIAVTGTYDPNDFALLLVMAMPVIFYMMQEEKKGRKLFLFGMLVLSVITILKTGSRGGLLSLMTVVLVMLYRKGLKYIVRIAPLAIMGLIIVGIAVDESYWDRFATILEPAKDYNATEKLGRVQVWKNGLELMLENPVLGIGAGAFSVAEGMKHEGGKWSAAHNSFIQIGAELGVGGLILFCLLIYKSIKSLRRMDTEIRWLQQGVEVALYGFCIGGFLLSWAYSYVIYFYVCLAIICQKISRQDEKKSPVPYLNGKSR